MKLRSSIHSFYNRVCVQQCSESLAVQKFNELVLKWFLHVWTWACRRTGTAYFCFFSFLFCASIVNTFYWISLNWIYAIDDLPGFFVCVWAFVKNISIFVWGRVTRRENNRSDRGRAFFCLLNFGFAFFFWLWWKQIVCSMANNRTLNICRHIYMICTLFSSSR